MKNIMANSLRIFTRSKDYISMVVVVPIVIFLLMTILLPYTKNHSIAVINKTDDTAMEDALEHLDGIDIQDIDEDDIAKRIVGGNIDLAVIIDETEEGLVYAQVISAGETEISGAVNLAIQNAKDTENTDNSVTVNADDRGRRSMGNSSAFMIYKFLGWKLARCLYHYGAEETYEGPYHAEWDLFCNLYYRYVYNLLYRECDWSRNLLSDSGTS